MTISKIEKFINLKMPSDIPNIPLLRGFLYMRLFYYLVIKLNNDPNKKKYYYLPIFLYFISTPFLYIVFTYILSITNQIDFLKNIKHDIFQNDVFRYFLEIIFYFSTFWFFLYLTTTLGQKVFDKLLRKIIIKAKGSIDSTNHFSFLDSIYLDKYSDYRWVEKKFMVDYQDNSKTEKAKKTAFRRRLWLEGWKSPDMYIEDNNILYVYAITYYNSRFRYAKRLNFPSFFYYNFMLRIFIFNSKNNIYNEMNRKNKWRFKLTYLSLISLNVLIACIFYIFFIKQYTISIFGNNLPNYLYYINYFLNTPYLVSWSLHHLNLFYYFSSLKWFTSWTLYK
ncbi:hypothetical protein [Mesomycoplasma conjunctivae]|uniref:hypothetical protein n=1 Tax=Mesomycoplasma conjunctivae TaxID=45361 RepID=UPI003DA4F9AF